MDLDALVNKMDQEVLGVEFCTSYVDLHGRRVGGFYCDQEIKPYCCTQLPQRKFCCSGVERLKLNAEQNFVLFERTFSVMALICAALVTALVAFVIAVLGVLFFQKCRRVLLEDRITSQPSPLATLDVTHLSPCVSPPTTNTSISDQPLDVCISPPLSISSQPSNRARELVTILPMPEPPPPYQDTTSNAHLSQIHV